MEFLAEHVLPLIESVAPVLAGIISVPIFNLIKRRVVPWIDGRSGWVKQLLVTVQTYVLAELSAVAGVVLPETLSGLTLDHTEAAVAAGIAFAVHAGKKAAGSNGAGAAAVLLAFLALAPGAEAQVTDSIQIEVNAPPVALDLGECSEGTFTGRAYVGTPVSCVFTAVDEFGNPTPATFSVESSDSAVAVPEMVDDSTATIDFLAPGDVTIYVTAEQIQVAFGKIAEPWDSSEFVLHDLSTEVGDTVRLCAYVFETALVDNTWRTFPTARSHRMCPMGPVDAPGELPVLTFEWESSDTTVLKFIPDEDTGTVEAMVPPGGFRTPASISIAPAADA